MRVRYETPNAKGETRADRNTRFGQDVPEWNIPDEGLYLWEWYFEISSGTDRASDGLARRITWAEFLAWSQARGEIVSIVEFEILRAMDTAYVIALAEEIANATAMQRQEADHQRPGGKWQTLPN